jgi:hypothetical protein
VPLLPRPSDTNSEGSTEKGAAVVVSSIRPAVDLRQFLCAATKQRELSLASIGVWSQRAEVAALPLLRCGWMPPRRRPPVRRAAVDGYHACAGVMELATALGDLASVINDGE